ncbi:MAG TPA: hypothetical protein VG796_19345 [Verrucomicrobiales bacterium]|nr:hypothetical protein [Verrucomicrobiales bacterium]
MNARCISCRCLWAIALLLISPSTRAQEDDFEDGNDTGWTQYKPLGTFATATYSVTGGAYSLACTPSTNTAAGPARCAALRQADSYGSFCAMVDIVNFGSPAEEEASVGILARVQPGPGLGTTNGYVFTYQTESQDVEINRIDSEDPTNISGTIDVALQQGTAYRMIFFGVGSYLEGRIYDKSDLSTPLVTAVAIDFTYTQGTGGLLIFSNGNTRCSATFDNYSANDGTNPLLAIAATDSNLFVSWDAGRGLGRTLEASSNLEQWETLTALTTTGGSTQYTEPIVPAVRRRFFRLRLGPPPP